MYNVIVTIWVIVQVNIANKQLESIFSSEKSLNRKFGQEMTKKILLRLSSLEAAANLGDFWPPYSGPERCHELKGGFKGYFSMDLKHPYRLLILPLEDISRTEFPDEVDRWKQIKKVVIYGVKNTHG